jgi:L-arabinose isomerase
VYFSLFDEQMPPDFRARQEATAELYRDSLGPDFEVVYPGLIAGDEDGRRANALFRAAAVEVILFAPVMAAPPSYAAHALDGLTVPVVIWNAPLVDRLGADLDQASAHEHTTVLAAIMLGNVLFRQGRSVSAVTASPHDPAGVEMVRTTVRRALAPGGLSGGVLLRIGDPIDGYLDVETTASDLEALGMREERIDGEGLVEAMAEVGSEELDSVREELARRRWSGVPDDRSLTLAAALWLIVEKHGAVAGTVNCHGPLFRFGSEVGICACLGVSLATGRGVPFSCTGDQPTAIALAIGRALAGAALYSEFFAPELSTGLVLLANGGEGDPAWAHGPVEVAPSQHYPGVNGRGASVSFALPAGPCTVLSVTPGLAGWRGVWTHAELVETRYPRLGAPNAMLRFSAEGTVGEVLDAWAVSGATHHHALLPGHVGTDLTQALAKAQIEPLSVPSGCV